MYVKAELDLIFHLHAFYLLLNGCNALREEKQQMILFTYGMSRMQIILLTI